MINPFPAGNHKDVIRNRPDGITKTKFGPLKTKRIHKRSITLDWSVKNSLAGLSILNSANFTLNYDVYKTHRCLVHMKDLPHHSHMRMSSSGNIFKHLWNDWPYSTKMDTYHNGGTKVSFIGTGHWYWPRWLKILHIIKRFFKNSSTEQEGLWPWNFECSIEYVSLPSLFKTSNDVPLLTSPYI